MSITRLNPESLPMTGGTVDGDVYVTIDASTADMSEPQTVYGHAMGTVGTNGRSCQYIVGGITADGTALANYAARRVVGNSEVTNLIQLQVANDGTPGVYLYPSGVDAKWRDVLAVHKKNGTVTANLIGTFIEYNGKAICQFAMPPWIADGLKPTMANTSAIKTIYISPSRAGAWTSTPVASTYTYGINAFHVEMTPSVTLNTREQGYVRLENVVLKFS